MLFITTIFNEYVKIKKNKKIAVILDQFKYKDQNDLRSIEGIRKTITNSNNLFLIVCSSLNYKDVKLSLIYHFFKGNNSREEIPKFEYYNKLTNNKDNFTNDDYLEKLEFLPRYCNIHEILNQKFINLIKKQLKIKF